MAIFIIFNLNFQYICIVKDFITMNRAIPIMCYWTRRDISESNHKKYYLLFFL
jgi:hypothetical protein